jgi:MYXO-CTERM domain-containing protein
MKRAKVSTTVRAGVLALSLFLFPLTTTTFAQTTLLGLAGLFGLMGLRRRPVEKVAAYNRP